MSSQPPRGRPASAPSCQDARAGGPGPHWSVPAAVAGVCALLLALLAVATVVRHGAAYPLDASAHRWALVHRDRVTVDLAVVVTESGTGVAAYGLAAVAGALAARTVWWRGALLGLVILGLGQVVRITIAHGIGRQRPPAADWAWSAGGPAMPSGHTTTSAIVAVLLTVGLARRLHGKARPPLLVLPALWALAVGASRVWLGMHWATDVVAGWLLAAVWTALIGLLLLPRRRAVAASVSTPPQG